MAKLKMHSRDVVGGNVENIAALFPQCVTERLNKDGKPELAIDFDKLRGELSNEVLEEGEERYQFTWPDKRAASRLANEPVNLTLRPCREDSVGKDGIPGGFDSENLYIERRIHFAVMAIESGARKLGISGKEMHNHYPNNRVS